MDIKINSVNFNGKKEVLYALTKAAQNAKDFEYYNQPMIASRMMTRQLELQTSQNASINAYLDMALRDSEFKNVVKTATDRDFSYIKQLLAEEKTEHSVVEPMKKFKDAISTTVIDNYNGRAQESMMSYVRELLQKLKL